MSERIVTEEVSLIWLRISTSPFNDNRHYLMLGQESHNPRISSVAHREAVHPLT
jgi:hypothetical protein